MKILVVLVLMMGFVSSNVFAGTYNGINSIVSINLHDSGNIIIKLSGASHSEECAMPQYNKVIALDKNNQHFEKMYAMALAAHASGKSIGGWVNGCVDLWGNGSAVMPRAITMVVY